MFYIRRFQFLGGDLSTHFDEEEYYNHPDNKEKGRIFLTNGTNKFFMPGGGGTNAAISYIDQKAFKEDNKELIYRPDPTKVDADMAAIIMSPDQEMVHMTDKACVDPAGTVYYSKMESSRPIFENVVGVYHVNGVAWDSTIGSKENREKMVPLITDYYDKIIKDFLTKAKEKDILHLVRTPGNIYGDRGETTIGMMKAVRKNLLSIISKKVYLNLDVSEESLTEVCEDVAITDV